MMLFAFDIVPLALKVDRTPHRRALYDTSQLRSSAVPQQQEEHCQQVDHESDGWCNRGDEHRTWTMVRGDRCVFYDDILFSASSSLQMR
jgi:hypothetical protein